jgi:predicted ATPase
MISRVEAWNFRSLRDLAVELGSFQVFVGPNESGKSSLFDVIAFLGSIVSRGLDEAVDERTENPRDLVWKGQGKRIELAVEASIPEDKKLLLSEPAFDRIRYEVALGLVGESGETHILAERVLLKTVELGLPEEREFFPFDTPPRKTILTPRSSGLRTIVSKTSEKKDNYYSEVYPEPGKGWVVAFSLGPRKSALGNLPEDDSKFPVSNWFKNLLTEKIHYLAPDVDKLRKPSPPGQPSTMSPDGGNLPWVIEKLSETSPDSLRSWIEHVKTALPDIETVRWVERREDKHRFLIIRYRSGLEIPSWAASSGTLRLLALTLPAYGSGLPGVYLLEEPDRGMYPRAVRAMFQSLSRVPSAQILVITYSPVILSAAEPHQVVCFAKTEGGSTDVIAGNEHPALRQWRGEKNLGVLYADGVLGS